MTIPNTAIRAVWNEMQDSGRRTRSTPTGEITEPEQHELFDRLCQALMEYGKALGFDVMVQSVDHLNNTIKTSDVETSLASLRVATYQALCAHGMADYHDDLVRLFANAKRDKIESEIQHSKTIDDTPAPLD